MALSKLERLCRVWQRRLRLQDWKVTPVMVPEPDMPEYVGEIPLDMEEMTATLRVREDADVEATVIHELLHLRLLPFSDGDQSELNHNERERAINLLADCFLRAYPRR
jgi:hypothetical protein